MLAQLDKGFERRQGVRPGVHFRVHQLHHFGGGGTVLDGEA